MEVSLKGKRVLITGAGRGIGKELVITFSKQGAIVYALTKNPDNLAKLKAECPNIIPIQADLLDWEGTKKALEAIKEPMDCLVNNAGIAEIQNFGDITPEAFDMQFGVNVKGLINVSQIISKKMIEAGIKGSIVHVSSVSSMNRGMGIAAYCATKAAVDMMTKCMAVELGPHGIRTNSVNPTVVWNDMGKQLWSDPAKSSSLLARIPAGRFADPIEVVNAVNFLLSDKCMMTTGETFLVDGGYNVW